MPFEVTTSSAKKEGRPAPIWWAKACRQLGLGDVKIEQVTTRCGPEIKVKLPELPPSAFWEVEKRAELLAERDAEGLPTEERPSGGFPASEDEVTDPIALNVAVDGDRVFLDLGRPVRAVSIHPAAASYLGALLTQAAFEAAPQTKQKMQDMTDMNVQVAFVQDKDFTMREAMVKLGEALVGPTPEQVLVHNAEEAEEMFGGGGKCQ